LHAAYTLEEAFCIARYDLADQLLVSGLELGTSTEVQRLVAKGRTHMSQVAGGHNQSRLC
jgi:hypothetical protein